MLEMILAGEKQVFLAKQNYVSTFKYSETQKNKFFMRSQKCNNLELC